MLLLFLLLSVTGACAHDSTIQRMNNVVEVFQANYGTTDYSPILTDSLYRLAIKRGQNNVPRSLAGMAVAFAYLGRRGGGSGTTSSAISLIDAVIEKYEFWTGTLIPPEESFNLAPTTAYSLGLASWLVWEALSNNMRSSVKKILVRESDYQLLRKPASGFEKDTKAEENAIVPGLLAMTSILFPDEPNAVRWEAQARCFAYHSITTKGDSAYCGVRTVTAYESFDMDNHNFGPHPLYMAAPLVHFADAALVYRAADRNVPWELKHHIHQLWNRLKTYLEPDYTWSGHNSWQPTGLNREISALAFMVVVGGVDGEREAQLLAYRSVHQVDFVEKKVGEVPTLSAYTEDWFNNLYRRSALCSQYPAS